MNYPKELLENIYWSFSNNSFEDKETFIENLVNYNKQIENEINPDEIVIHIPEMIVRFIYQDVEDEDEKYKKDDNDSSSFIDFDIKSDNNKYITSGELLYKIHMNVLTKANLHDYKFFEGIEFLKKKYDSIPIYVLMLGS